MIVLVYSSQSFQNKLSQHNHDEFALRLDDFGRYFEDAFEKPGTSHVRRSAYRRAVNSVIFLLQASYVFRKTEVGNFDDSF